MNRLLKYINLLIALLSVAAATLVWWYGYRVLPQTSGAVPAPVSSRVSAARDPLGVAHITAASVDDALFVQGYVTAQDRLFQMEVQRRLSAGTLGEVFGPPGLESDIETRPFRLNRVAEQHARNLSPEDRRALAAYARGVNFFIETHQAKLPVEFAIMGFDPAPWSIADSILTGLMMHRSLTSSWRDELSKQAMLDGGDPAKVEALFPIRTGAEPQPGSNAWVLAGSRTTSAKPLLANDPHLTTSLPGIWYQVHLKAPGLNVAGVSLPGLPGVIIGHNDRIAWGMTNLQFDVQDLVELPGSGVPVRQEREVFRVRGGRLVETAVFVTPLGPVFVTEGSRRYVLRWTATESGPFALPILDLNRARNWTEFLAALARFQGPASNFVFADVDGNIGYHAAGSLPVRKNHNGDLPVPAAAAAEMWQGSIPFDALPSSYNPASGAIITANQNPFPLTFPFRVNGNFAPHYRARQIQALLAARPKWGPADLLTVQKDVYSSFHHFVARQLATAARGSATSSPLLSQALPLLESWNGQMEHNQPAPLLVSLAVQHLRKAIVESVAPDKSARYDSAISLAVVERLLRERSRDWLPDWDSVLRRCLSDAAEEAARLQGRDPRKWAYGNHHEAILKNPILGDLRFIGQYFRIGPVPMSGSLTTVRQTSPRLAPSMRFVADLSNWDTSLLNLATGQSGQPLSPHYKDQWDSYYVGNSFPMQFDKVTTEATLVFDPQP